ncbi:MAG: HDOD domain-containing protein [Clostridiales bacterium]|nr:HDOD domain-containing protein [Clostridiales bacterium]
MNVHIARQPIFDKDMNVYAYELLYRSGEGVSELATDGDYKTSEVVFNTLVTMGLDAMLSGCKAFINFTKETINNKLPEMFSNKILVVELLEDIIPDDLFINQCQRLKSNGYLLALDDFDSSYAYEEVVKMVDIIKVDFMLTTQDERRILVKKYKNNHVRFLAEKVESIEEFNEAKNMGYDYFQGFFFSKPILVSGNDFKTFNSAYALILTELNNPEPSYDVLEGIIKKDFSITFKLLKLVNSAAFYSRNRITSIKHALTMIGFKELRKWFSLMMVRDAGQDQPKELIRMSLIRARLAESLIKSTVYKKRASEGFLLGLFSMIDVILDRRMVEIIDDLPLEPDIIAALYNEESTFLGILKMIQLYEHGEWKQVKQLLEAYDLDFLAISTFYLEAIDWVNIIEEMT